MKQIIPRSRRLGLVLSLFGLLALGATTGCAAKRDSSLQKDVQQILKPTQQGDFEAVMAEAQGHWEKRIARAELELAIAKWEKAATVDMGEVSDEERKQRLAEIFEKLARGYYFLADSHIFLTGDDPEENYPAMMEVFEKGLTASEKAMALRDPGFVARIADGASWQDEVPKINPAAIPALYWYATNLGKWALLEGIATILARKDDIKSIMDFIVEKDPQYFYGAPHRYFGSYWVRLPFGKQPETSKRSFEASIKIAPNYFATRVLMAEMYAPVDNNPALFKEQLQFVLNTPADIDPEVVAENTFEQEKARRLMARADRMFRDGVSSDAAAE